MAAYGRTWWSKKWLEAFTGIDCDNRLPRGRTYANTGRAYDIKIDGSTISAKVRGSRKRPYQVKIELNPFSRAEQGVIKKLISGSPAVLAGLVNGRLPSKLYSDLAADGITLFPSRWSELEAQCSCPDWAMPCKHIAAVIYLIAAEIDKNPFVVFTIHDCDLLTLVGAFKAGSLARVKKIMSIDELSNSDDAVESTFDQSVLDGIDLSTIPVLAGNVMDMLHDDPLFFDKNFRDILQLVYKHWSRYPLGTLERFYPATTREEDTQAACAHFIHSWNNPPLWNSLTLTIDNTHQLVSMWDESRELLKNGPGRWRRKRLSDALFLLLRDVPPTLLHKLNPHVRFMHIVAQSVRRLMQQSAVIPQILQNDSGQTLVRWTPALFDPTVRELFTRLCATCPTDLVTYKGIRLPVQEQVKAAFALLFAGCIRDNLPSTLTRHANKEIMQLFFAQHACSFTEFSNSEIPSAIHTWLSHLYLHERPHKLYMAIEEADGDFTLDIKVSLSENEAPIPLNKAIAKTRKADKKLALLSDLALVTEHIPEMERVIDTGEASRFTFESFASLFLHALPTLKAMGIKVILPKSLRNMAKPQLQLKLTSKEKLKDARESFLNLDALLEFDWRVSIGDKTISPAMFKTMLKDSHGLVRLMDQYVLLDESEMRLLLKRLDNLPEQLGRSELMQSMLAGECDGASVEIDGQLRQLLHSLDSYTPASVPANLNAILRPYQQRGFSWLVQNIQTSFGSILADDMGLGKTIQVIASILHCKNRGFLTEDRVLIVAPTSLLSNWQREIERFAPDLTLHVYHGNKRMLLQNCDIVITSYGLARRDKQLFKKNPWFLLVIDEAQNIKNPFTDQTKAIKAITAKHKIAMSGTPVENRLSEYWSIFDFVNKHYLGTEKQFRRQFAIPIERDRDKQRLDCFLKVTSPFMLRRLKTDKTIIQDLPAKVENNRYCTLTSEQAALYQETVDMTMKSIQKSDGIARKGLVFKLINSLKHICNHPSHFKKRKKAEIAQSGKMQMLEQIIDEIDQSGEKVLIFTQYTQMGNLMADLLERRFGAPVPFLHGGLSRTVRDQMVQEFQGCPQKRIFIISLKAGGTGLNLTAASHVVHYDLWWNPAVEAQATDRAYRIGQQRRVMVHRLITTGTFEEKINAMIQSKKELADLAVGTGEKWVTEMSNDQLHELVNIRSSRSTARASKAGLML